MRYCEIEPNNAAKHFVRCYWILEDPEPAWEVQRIVPDGRAELILNLAQPYCTFATGVWRRQPDCFLFGQITGPLLLRPSGPTHILGVRFHPHTAGKLLRLSMGELTDSMLPLDLIPARAARRIRELEGARTLDEQAAVLDRMVLELARGAGDNDRLLDAAVRELGRSISVRAVSYHAGISTRQLERRFRQAVGIPPKLFARMQRFQRVFQALETAGTSWAEAALRCGYHDQAHLIRDFREFSGKPPAALVAQGTDLASYFVGLDVSHFSNTRAAGSR